MIDSRKKTVQAGYDRMARRHLTWEGKVEGDPRERFLEQFVGLLPAGGRVLDLGCGAGVPSTRRLAEEFDVVGVDISAEQLRLARENVPTATLIQADLLKADFPGSSFDGITAFYSISHIPREEHAELFGLISKWLRPAGFLLASLGAGDSPDWTGEWLGVPMFFSSFDADANRRLIADAGMVLIHDEVVPMREPEGEAIFLWVIARKPAE